MLLNSFSVDHLLLDIETDLKVVCFHSETFLEESNFSLQVVIFQRKLHAYEQGFVSTLFNSKTLSGAKQSRTCACCLSLCDYICVLIIFFQRTMLSWYPPSPVATTFFLHPLQERDLMEASMMRLGRPQTYGKRKYYLSVKGTQK